MFKIWNEIDQLGLKPQDVPKTFKIYLESDNYEEKEQYIEEKKKKKKKRRRNFSERTLLKLSLAIIHGSIQGVES